MKKLRLIVERDSINREVAAKGRQNNDREMPSSASDKHLGSRPDLRTRRKTIRNVSKRIRNGIFDNSPDLPKSSRRDVVSNRTMRRLGEETQ